MNAKNIVKTAVVLIFLWVPYAQADTSESVAVSGESVAASSESVAVSGESVAVSDESVAAADERVATSIDAGWNSFSREELTEAQDHFKKAVDLEPLNTEALMGLGKTAMYLDQLAAAEEAFDKILEVDPNHTEARLSLAKVYSWSERYQQSIATYGMVLESDPDNKTALMGLAEVYGWKGHYEKSINQYKMILSEDPRNAEAYKGLAEVYSWENRLQESRDIYEKSLEQWPENVELRLGYAKILEWNGDWSLARDQYEEALYIEPENTNAQEGIREIKRTLAPQHEFSFESIYEKDGLDWRAHSITSGYQVRKLLNRGNSIYAGDYINYLKETNKGRATGNIVELGGQCRVTDWLNVGGSSNMRAYGSGTKYFVGGEVSGNFRYLEKNTVSIRYSRDLFDFFDKREVNYYGAESNIFLGEYLQFTDLFTYGDISDGNFSTDTYHDVTVLILKTKPDFNVSFGYRRRDFDTSPEEYYSPPHLWAFVYSAYLGHSIGNFTPYFMFKWIDNSNRIDDYYYLWGMDIKLNDHISTPVEVSFFETDEAYQALSITASLDLKF